MKHQRDHKSKAQDLHPQETLKLSDREKEQVVDRVRPDARIIHEVIRLEGEGELRRPVSALAWSGLAAGLSMGFSLVGRGLLETHLPDQPWRYIIAGLGYSIGFLIVILGRQQLFTENTLTVILPLLSRRSREAFLQVMRLWSVVLVSNLVGTLLFAWIVGHIGVFSPEVQQTFTEIGIRAIKPGFLETLWRAIFAGWLIALMVWLLPTAESSQVWIIVIVTSLVGLGELSHIIAGSVEALYAVTTGAASWGAYWIKFMIPTLMGNILGGVSLVAALNHAQVAPKKD